MAPVMRRSRSVAMSGKNVFTTKSARCRLIDASASACSPLPTRTLTGTSFGVFFISSLLLLWDTHVVVAQRALQQVDVVVLQVELTGESVVLRLEVGERP